MSRLLEEWARGAPTERLTPPDDWSPEYLAGPPEGAPIDPREEEAEGPGPHPYLAFASRLIPPLVGTVAGALSPVPGGAVLGGAAGGAAGEAFAQWVNDEAADPQEVAIQAALGAIPGFGKARTVAQGLALRGAQGAAYGAGTSVVRDLTHGREVSGERALVGGVAGGALGSVLGSVEGALAGRAARQAVAAGTALEAVTDARRAQETAAQGAYRATEREILDTLPVADRALFQAYQDGRVSLARPDGTPFDPEQFATIQAAAAAREDALQALERAQGWHPDGQAAEAATRAMRAGASEPEVMDAVQVAAQEAEAAGVARRVEPTPVTIARDKAFQGKVDAGRVQDDAATVTEMLAEDAPPTLGQLGLPAVSDDAGGVLSAADPHSLAPTVSTMMGGPRGYQRMIAQLAAQHDEAMGQARRGVQTIDQIKAEAWPIVEELAKRVGQDPDKFLRTLRKRGEAANASQLFALRRIATSLTGEFYEASKLAKRTRDPVDIAEAARKMTLAQGILAHGAGAVAEDARAVRMMQERTPLESLQQDVVGMLLRRARKTPEQMEAIIDSAADLGTDANAMTQFMLQASTLEGEGPRFSDKLYEYYINALLSGPVTHVVNNVSNGLMALGRLPETALAGGLDVLHAKVTGQARERFAGEAIADGFGMMRGFPGGLRAGLRAFQTELPQYGHVTKFEQAGPRVAIAGRVGRAVRMPGRAMLAADEVWKGIGLEGATSALAYREAAQAGLTGQARVDRIAALLADPASRARLSAAAEPEMLARVFQQEAGPITNWVLKGRQMVPGARWVLPFVRIGANIARSTIERTPLGLVPLIQRARKGQLGDGEAQDRMAKMLIGTALGGWVGTQVAQGAMTGSGPGPRERGARAMQSTVGPPPNSIRIGNTWLGFDRLGPVGLQLSLAANAVQAFSDPLVSPEDAATRVGFGFGRQMSEQSFLTGVRHLLDAAEDEQKATGYLKRFAASFVPNIVKQLTRAVDPRAKRMPTLPSRFRATLPGTGALPGLGAVLPLRNLWGEPIQNSPGGITSLVSPFRLAPARTDPVSVELARLVKGVGLRVGAPQASRTVGGVTTLLDPADYDRLSMQAGALAKGLVTELVESWRYRNATDDEARAEMVEKQFAQARTTARKALGRELDLRGEREQAARMPLDDQP